MYLNIFLSTLTVTKQLTQAFCDSVRFILYQLVKRILVTAARPNWNVAMWVLHANCINIQYEVYKPFENVNVYYQRLITFELFY